MIYCGPTKNTPQEKRGHSGHAQFILLFVVSRPLAARDLQQYCEYQSEKKWRRIISFIQLNKEESYQLAFNYLTTNMFWLSLPHLTLSQSGLPGFVLVFKPVIKSFSFLLWIS